MDEYGCWDRQQTASVKGSKGESQGEKFSSRTVSLINPGFLLLLLLALISSVIQKPLSGGTQLALLSLQKNLSPGTGLWLSQ